MPRPHPVWRVLLAAMLDIATCGTVAALLLVMSGVGPARGEWPSFPAMAAAATAVVLAYWLLSGRLGATPWQHLLRVRPQSSGLIPPGRYDPPGSDE